MKIVVFPTIALPIGASEALRSMIEEAISRMSAPEFDQRRIIMDDCAARFAELVEDGAITEEDASAALQILWQVEGQIEKGEANLERLRMELR